MYLDAQLSILTCKFDFLALCISETGRPESVVLLATMASSLHYELDAALLATIVLLWVLNFGKWQLCANCPFLWQLKHFISFLGPAEDPAGVS